MEDLNRERLDWTHWAERWEAMQARYVPRRRDRFALMSRLVRTTQGPEPCILDLGCGPGSLMRALLSSLPGSRVWGVDVDPTLELLAEHRLACFGDRARLFRRDLRSPSWAAGLAPVDAVVSATALHWLTEARLRELYGEIAKILKPGGLFLNADHVCSDNPELQRAWERDKEAHVHGSETVEVDDWDSFWEHYLETLGPEWRNRQEVAVGAWEGSDAGLCLAWHLDALRASGFADVDCFWRESGDAIYGGFRPMDGSGSVERALQ